MNQHRKLLHKYQNKYLLNSIVFCISACLVIAALFSSPGLVAHYFHLDLSFLLLPFLGYFVLRFIAKQPGVTLAIAKSGLISIILNGMALAFLVYFLFNNVQLFSRIPWLTDKGNVLDSLARVSSYLVVIIAGYTVREVSGLLQLDAGRLKLSPLVSAIGWALVGLGLWLSLNTLSAIWPPFHGAGIVVFAGTLVVALSGLGYYGINSKIKLISDLSEWVCEKPFEKFLAGSLIVAYILFLRPALYSWLSTAYLIEWLVFCILAWSIFSGAKDRLEKHYIFPLKESEWQKHVQQIEDLVDEDFNKLVVLQEDFVAGGSRRELLIYISQLLAQNGFEEGAITSFLSPMIEYSDNKVPWYAFGFFRQRILEQNRKTRRDILVKTIKQLNGTGLQPE